MKFLKIISVIIFLSFAVAVPVSAQSGYTIALDDYFTGVSNIAFIEVVGDDTHCDEVDTATMDCSLLVTVNDYQVDEVDRAYVVGYFYFSTDAPLLEVEDFYCDDEALSATIIHDDETNEVAVVFYSLPQDGLYDVICYFTISPVGGGGSIFPVDGVVAVCGFTILLFWIPRAEVRALPVACALLFQPYWLEAAFVAYCVALLLGTLVFALDWAGGFSND